MTRSSAARKRRGPSVRRVLTAEELQAAGLSIGPQGVDAGSLCRRCFTRPHVPCSEYCGKCRYYERSKS